MRRWIGGHGSSGQVVKVEVLAVLGRMMARKRLLQARSDSMSPAQSDSMSPEHHRAIPSDWRGARPNFAVISMLDDDPRSPYIASIYAPLLEVD